MKVSAIAALAEYGNRHDLNIIEPYCKSSDIRLRTAATTYSDSYHIVINKLQLGIVTDRLNHPVFTIPGICPIAIGQHIAVIIISGLIGVDNRVLVQHIGCIVVGSPGKICSQPVTDGIKAVSIIIGTVLIGNCTDNFAAAVVGITDRIRSRKRTSGSAHGGTVADGIVCIAEIAYRTILHYLKPYVLITLFKNGEIIRIYSPPRA